MESRSVVAREKESMGDWHQMELLGMVETFYIFLIVVYPLVKTH